MPKMPIESQEMTKKEYAILVFLGTYKFLSTPQIVRLCNLKNISQSPSPQNYYPSIKRLEELGLIKRISHGKEGWGKGRLPDISYLTPAGKETLSESPECPILPDEIRFVPSKTQASDKLFVNHKMAVADFLISFLHHSENTELDFTRYEADFDFVGGQRTEQRLKPKTRMNFEKSPETESLKKDSYTPDVVILYNENGEQRALIVEVCMGNLTDAIRIGKQMREHKIALYQKLPQKHYNLSRYPDVLFVFKEPKTLQKVMRSAEEYGTISGFERFFSFALLESIEKGFDTKDFLRIKPLET
jgi:DNA-binding PadR family transcriptional regulator